jgi:hypothetical protein
VCEILRDENDIRISGIKYFPKKAKGFILSGTQEIRKRENLDDRVWRGVLELSMRMGRMRVGKNMSSRGISVLGLIQLCLVFGIWVMNRIGARFAEEISGGKPQPVFIQFLQSYGIWLIAVPIVWTVLSAFLSMRGGVYWGRICVVTLSRIYSKHHAWD